jgi:hypothetical protein
VEYPENLSRGLVLVKWWLFAIPHYLVIAFFTGGGAGIGFGAGSSDLHYGGGLIFLLVLFGVVVLLFKGTYPGTIFDLVVGLNRWVLRVVAYAALMTDRYPPFRLDVGPNEPAPATTATAP